MQGLGATAVAGAGLASTNGPVGEAEAIPPIAIGGAALGGSAAFGWALREFELIGSDDPPEGLTPEALHQRVYETARARKSTNASTFVDNKNIVDGLEHTAYVDGKIAAIDALNEQVSKSDVQDAALDAVDAYATTVKKNLLKGWNESVSEMLNLVNTVESHPDLDLLSDMLDSSSDSYIYNAGSSMGGIGALEAAESDFTMPDGSTFPLKSVYISVDSSARELEYSPTHIDVGGSDSGWNIPPDKFSWATESGDVTYLDYNEWSPIYDNIESAFTDVRDGLILWVDSVYSDIQSGEIEIEELITPRERAAMMAEDESMAQAIADLQALNIPIDVEREATIYLSHVDGTVRGTLGITQDQSIKSGETYDPDEDIDGSVYLTYDASLGEGTWGAYETGVEAGIATFTEEPWPEVTYEVHTIADEIAEVQEDDFTPRDSGGDEVQDLEDPDHWTVDLSDQLENQITEIDEVHYYSGSDEGSYETIQLAEEFTVESIENTSTGEESESMDFESSEPQTDDNYITQEEWEELEQQNQELIERYEDSQSSGGIGDLLGGDIGGVPTALIALVAAAAAAFGLTD